MRGPRSYTESAKETRRSNRKCNPILLSSVSNLALTLCSVERLQHAFAECSLDDLAITGSYAPNLSRCNWATGADMLGSLITNLAALVRYDYLTRAPWLQCGCI